MYLYSTDIFSCSQFLYKVDQFLVMLELFYFSRVHCQLCMHVSVFCHVSHRSYLYACVHAVLLLIHVDGFSALLSETYD
jgi:hypothetical protein